MISEEAGRLLRPCDALRRALILAMGAALAVITWG